MFAGCNNLDSLDVTGFNTSMVIDFEYMFWACSSLPVINVSSLNTTNAASMKQMFSQCCAIQYLDLSGFDTSGVADMKAMFWKSNALICITNIDSTGANNPGGRDSIFTDCIALLAPDATDQSLIEGGANWVNPGTCP